MSDIKLFKIQIAGVAEVQSDSVALEKSLQSLIENNLETILGVRFLATEYATGKTHSGRIDTLGIDENACPVILEYKRAVNENVINQGLFYLDWLLDHKAEFKFLVLDKYGRAEADKIDWAGTRLLCIASDFTRYDEHAVQQINRNIELIRYRRFADDLLLLDLVNAVTSTESEVKPIRSGEKRWSDLTAGEAVGALKGSQLDLYEGLRAFVIALGDDVQEKQLKLYIAYKRFGNFLCLEVHKDKLVIYLKLNPETVNLEPGFSRDVRSVGHWGTGDLEVVLKSPADLEKAKPLILQGYGAS